MSKRRVMVLLAGLIFLPTSAARADGPPCQAAVQQRLAELGIQPGAVGKIDYQTIRLSGRQGGAGRVIGIEAAVVVDACPQGRLVLTFNRTCESTGAFTTGKCEIEGVSDC